MFRLKRPNLRFIEEPIGDGEPQGGGTDTVEEEIDYSTFGVEDEPEIPAAESTEPEKPAPAVWDDVLSVVPEGLHGLIKPKLQEWEKGTTQRFQAIHEQYAPWKKFQDEGLTPDVLRQRYELTQQIDSDPVQFMERMKAALVQAGLYQEAQQVQGEINAEKAAQAQAEEEEELTPAERRLAEQQQAFFQQVEQRRIEDEQREIQRQADIQTDTEIAALNQKYGGAAGKISDVLMRETLQKAWLMGQQSGQYVPLEAAFKEVQKLISASRQVTKPAPRVMPPGGGLPAPTNKSVGQMTEAERKAAAVAVVERMQAEARGD